MNGFNGIVVSILVWWLTLFAMLPLWVRPADPAHGADAPQHPHPVRKAVAVWPSVRGP